MGKEIKPVSRNFIYIYICVCVYIYIYIYIYICDIYPADEHRIKKLSEPGVLICSTFVYYLSLLVLTGCDYSIVPTYMRAWTHLNNEVATVRAGLDQPAV